MRSGPHGLAISASDHVPRSFAHFEIFKRFERCLCDMLLKSEADMPISDFGLHSETYGSIWSVLVNNRYQGILSITRVVHP